jgi:anaerobic magnesium-protoporphyrin IX monomethyl ester cyclase
MKIAFVKPPYVIASYYGCGNDFVPPAVSETVLAAWLEKSGYEAEIIDCHAGRMSWDDLGILLEERKIDVACVSGTMTTFHDDYIRAIKLIKEKRPETVTIGGGIHFSLIPEKIMEQCPELDYLVKGEGEITLTELIAALENNDDGKIKGIDGVYYRESGKIVANRPRELFKDLDLLPDPAWHLIPKFGLNPYSFTPEEWGDWTILVTSRGCVGKCTFCSPMHTQGKYREMSANRTLDMIEHAYKTGKTTIWIDDLAFNINRKRIEKFLDGIIERKIKAHFLIHSRPEYILRDRDILHKYREAGIEMVHMGAESYSQDDLDIWKKGISVNTTVEAVSLLKENDMASWVFFMLGAWEHSITDVNAMIDFSKKLDPDVAIFCIATPYPGTDYAADMEKMGIIETSKYRLYDQIHGIMPTKHLTREEIHKLRGRAFFEFYRSDAEKIERKLQSKNEFTRHWYRRLIANANVAPAIPEFE